MKKILAIQVIDVLTKVAARNSSKKVDISSVSSAKISFNKFIQMGTDVYGWVFASHLSDAGITNANQFAELLMSESFKDILRNDSIGKNAIKQIKYPSAAKIADEMKSIHDKYKNQMTTNSDEVSDTEQTYAIRTQFGDGPIVFVKGVRSDEGRHEVRRWYAWAHGINYFEVRECSYEYWANNPGMQIATNL